MNEPDKHRFAKSSHSLRVSEIESRVMESEKFSVGSLFSKAVRLERSSSSLLRMVCHLAEKTRIEWEVEINEDIWRIACCNLGIWDCSVICSSPIIVL